MLPSGARLHQSKHGEAGMSEGTDTAAGEPKAPPMKHGGPRAGVRPRQGIGLTIGQALQAHYDDLVAAPMPDRFLALLAELEAREQQRG